MSLLLFSIARRKAGGGLKLFSQGGEGLIGIDISSVGIKLVELSRDKDGLKLASMAITTVPRDAIVENTIIDSMAVSGAIRDALDIAQPGSRRAAFAVSGNAAIIKMISLPVMSEFDLESEIVFEADEYIPYNIDEVFLDFQILGESTDNPEQMDVVLVACKRELIEDYQLVLKEAGLEAACADCSVFCLENTAEIIQPLRAENDEQGTVYALVNIGANLMNINILNNGRSSFVRDQFFGGQNLTDEIQRAHGISYEAAEEMKTKNFSAIGEEVLAGFYEGLASELVRSLDFYVANHADKPVQKVLVSGGSALIPGIDKELSERLGIETEVLNPFSVIDASGKKFDAAYLQRIGPMMVVPVGLALRSFDE